MNKGQDFFKALYEALEKIVGSLEHDEVMKNVVETSASQKWVHAEIIDFFA